MKATVAHRISKRRQLTTEPWDLIIRALPPKELVVARATRTLSDPPTRLIGCASVTLAILARDVAAIFAGLVIARALLAAIADDRAHE